MDRHNGKYEDANQDTEKWSRVASHVKTERVVIEAIIEERERKRRSRRCKKTCTKVLKFFLSTTGLLVVNALVLVLGAFVFQHLEETNELQRCINLREDYYKAENKTLEFLMELTLRLDDVGPLSYDERAYVIQQYEDYLKSFALSVLDTQSNISVVCEDKGTPEGEEYKWSLSGSLIFSLTVVTTIGYGHIAPSTMWGRLVCIAYALIGIPIFMLALARIGEMLATFFLLLYSTVCCCGCCLRKKKKSTEITDKDEEYIQKAAAVWRLDPVSGRPVPPAENDAFYIEEEDNSEIIDEEEDEDSTAEELSVPLTVTLLIYFGFITFGAVTFSAIESEWGFLDALYFSTITATTIGFGDMLPDMNFKHKAGVFKSLYVMLYIVLSMAALSLCIQLITNKITNKFSWIMEKLRLRKKNEEENEKEDAVS